MWSMINWNVINSYNKHNMLKFSAIEYFSSGIILYISHLIAQLNSISISTIWIDNVIDKSETNSMIHEQISIAIYECYIFDSKM